MKILIKAYNNSNWLYGTDLIIWNLDKKLLKEIKFKSERLKKYFPDDFISIKKHEGVNFEIYSLDEDCEIVNNFLNSEKEFQVLKNDLNLNQNYDTKLSTYSLVIEKNHISLLCYVKYDNCIEIFSNEILIKDLLNIN